MTGDPRDVSSSWPVTCMTPHPWPSPRPWQSRSRLTDYSRIMMSSRLAYCLLFSAIMYNLEYWIWLIHSFIHSFIHFNSGSKAHKQQTEAMT